MYKRNRIERRAGWMAITMAACAGDALAVPRFELIAQQGQVVGGTALQSNFPEPLINQAGDIAFINADSASTLYDPTAYRYRNGALERVAGAGSIASGLSAGVTFAPNELLAFNSPGEMLLTADLTGMGVTPSNDTALIHISTNGSSTLVAREGAVTAGGGLMGFSYFGYGESGRRDTPALADDGQIAFAAKVSSTQDVLMAGYAGAMNVIASSTTAAPGQALISGAPVSATFTQFATRTGGHISSIDILADHSVSFSAFTESSVSSGSQTGLGQWKYKDGQFTPILTLATLPPLGFQIGGSLIRMNDAGAVSIRGTVRRTGQPYVYGEWVFKNNTLEQRALEGDAIEGEPGAHVSYQTFWATEGLAFAGDLGAEVYWMGGSGVTVTEADGVRAILTRAQTYFMPGVGEISATFAPFPSINNAGQVVSVSANIVPSTGIGQGIFVGDRRRMRPILVPGQTIDLGAAGTKTVSSTFATFVVSSGWDAGRLTFNDAGQVPVFVVFSDSTNGLILVTIPKPIPGDTNFDDLVTFDDLLALSQHYGETNTGIIEHGDFDYDGDVDFTDLLTLAQNYVPGSVQASDWSLLADASGNFTHDWQLAQRLAPEPVTAVFAAALVRRRRARIN